MNNQYVFLDIDGVLNSRPFMLKTFTLENPARGSDDILDPDAIEILNQIMDKMPEALIVVCSAWRIIHTPAQIGRMLTAKGFRYRRNLRGATGNRGSQMAQELKLPYEKASRGLEIALWLETLAEKPYRFCVLEDSQDWFTLKDHYVRCTDQLGLQPQHIAEALSVMELEPAAQWLDPKMVNRYAQY